MGEICLVVNVDGHADLDQAAHRFFRKTGDACAAVAGRVSGDRIAAVNGDAAVEIARVIDGAERGLSNAFDLPLNLETAAGRIGLFPFTFAEIFLVVAGRNG